MIRKDEIILYLAQHTLYRTISFFLIIQPLFPYFSFTPLLPIYTTNFLIENVFIYLFHCFLYIIWMLSTGSFTNYFLLPYLPLYIMDTVWS